MERDELLELNLKLQEIVKNEIESLKEKEIKLEDLHVS
jgi:hypothetical protein